MAARDETLEIIKVFEGIADVLADIEEGMFPKRMAQLPTARPDAGRRYEIASRLYAATLPRRVLAGARREI